jgi:hypothetical protein
MVVKSTQLSDRQPSTSMATIPADGDFLIAARAEGAKLSDKDARAARQAIMQVMASDYKTNPLNVGSQLFYYAEKQGRSKDQSFINALVERAKQWINEDKQLRQHMVNSGIKNPYDYAKNIYCVTMDGGIITDKKGLAF